MPRVKAGEMSLNEIRNLARQHNKASQIKSIDTLSRAKLISEIERMGYKVDHERKRIVKRTMNNIERKKQTKKIAPEGERKPQKRTKRKALIAGGDKPPMVKKVPKGFHRMPDGSIMADKDMPKKKKAKPPPIKPALEKQRKKKEEKEKKRKAFVSGSGYGS
jgi:hypothetical protein